MRTQQILGYLLSFLLGGALCYFLIPRNSTDMVSYGEKEEAFLIQTATIREGALGLVDTAKAHPNLRAHAADGAYAGLSINRTAKLKGILHDTTAFRKYVNQTFLEFTKSHQAKDGYVWQIGIYPMIHRQSMSGSMKPRIGFYLIPTMVRANVSTPTPADIIDYMYAMGDATLKMYYISNARRSNPVGPFDDEPYIFDEGHLWP